MAFSGKDLGIDLGTANTIVYDPEVGVILNEPSVIAYDKYTGEIIACGIKAKAMYGKQPRNIEVVRPLEDGVISDFDMTAEMLQILMRRALGDKKPSNLRVVVGVPSGVTEVEKRAVEEVVRQNGGKEVYILDEPTAAAIGAGLDVESPEASMICDIGGGTTDVAIISLGGLVVTNPVRYAGDKISAAVIGYIRKKKGVLIGEKTAEELKISVGTALVEKDKDGNEILRSVEARGRDIVSGLPKSFEVSNKDMEEAMRESVDIIVDAIKTTVEKAPPEIAADIAENGMTLSGGGAMIENLDKVVAKRTGMIVKIADNPYEAVAIGTGKSLENIERLRAYADIKIR